MIYLYPPFHQFHFYFVNYIYKDIIALTYALFFHFSFLSLFLFYLHSSHKSIIRFHIYKSSLRPPLASPWINFIINFNYLYRFIHSFQLMTKYQKTAILEYIRSYLYYEIAETDVPNI